MDDDPELEILSYKEFRNRETLQAWRLRQRVHQGEHLSERRSGDIADRASGEDIPRARIDSHQDQRPRI